MKRKAGIFKHFYDNYRLPDVEITLPPPPEYYYISNNYPNPFNPNTTIEYWLPLDEAVTIKLFDAIGREIKILVNEEKQAGKYKFEFNDFNYSSGIYFYQISAGRYQKTKKMLLLK